MAHTLPPLPYAYDALEPFISKEIMTLHHTKHHQTYVNALNAAEAAYAKASTPKERIALQAALKFNGGRCYRKAFGNLDNLKKEFNATTAGIQGSAGDGSYALRRSFFGVWADPSRIQGYNPSTKLLEVVTTANQDPLLTHVPIIGVDIWEHAFYLQYKNVKADVRELLLPPELKLT
ncbi:manganese superoxide dismutase [Salix suchowensis]|nr:manganese superoxide dismutase [Salix suchowensis]